MKNIKNILKNRSGATFIELLLYIAIFLILTPILLTVSINTARFEQQHNVEKQVNVDSQFVVERVYDLIAAAKRVDVSNSLFDDAAGKITLVMQDDDVVVIEHNTVTGTVDITEDSTTTQLSSENAKVESLYFERIEDELNDPEIILGVAVHLNISGIEEFDPVQEYITSANLERGDFDEDGSPDFLDKFPRHPECSGDADEDGICDELDNCILAYNPFQEDFDEDLIGDECDDSVFIEGGGGGGGGGFGCSDDQQMLDLLEQDPPLSSSQLKQILVSSSPLPPTVLNTLIDRRENNEHILTTSHFRQVFIINTKLPDDVYDNVVAMSNLSGFSKTLIIIAHNLAQWIPWLGVGDNATVNYDVTITQEGKAVKFDDPDNPLGDNSLQKTDIFIISVDDGTDDVTVHTEADNLITTNILSGNGDSVTDNWGFGIVLDKIVDDTYVFKISNVSNDDPLQSVEFEFGVDAQVTAPSNSYTTYRYTYYCPGGCSEACGDEGTGIITGNIFTDKCYRIGNIFPEWCSKWKTFTDDNAENPAYLGGTQTGEETAYWEKDFKTVLAQSQIDSLQSIMVTAEVAYQATTQFFCDTLASSCPMNATLVGQQDVELYDWQNSQWVVVGSMGLDGSTSDQQIFEVTYDDPDVLKFLDNPSRTLRSRIQFNWDGVPPPGNTTAPAFMLIDYFTLHLSWQIQI